MSFQAVLALPKTARSTLTHKSISFIWIVWSTRYVYLWTKDKDNDKFYSNCAEKGPYGNRGGWWYNACTRSNLNGLNYAEGTAIDEWIGIYWYKFGGSRNSMKTVTMSVIPKNPCMYHLDFTKKTLSKVWHVWIPRSPYFIYSNTIMRPYFLFASFSKKALKKSFKMVLLFLI